MKRIYLFIVVLLLFSPVIRAKTVSREMAKQKALTFLGSKDMSAVVETFSITGKAELYKVTTIDGWAVMSSDTNVKPVLAYSLIDESPTIEKMPDGMKWLFSSYEEDIAYAREHELEYNVWEQIANDKLMTTNSSIYLVRLKDVKWGQQENNSGDDLSCERIYNKFCPDFYSVSCDRTITGCGAVALGQVLWYYQWPHYGLIPMEMLDDEGNVSSEKEYKIYDWNLMPDSIISSTTLPEVDEIAYLLRDCGYAEHMEYGNGGSNTSVSNIKNALIYNYGYTNAQRLYRNNFNTTNWINKMKDEIIYRRPVLYRGGNNNNDDGHHFVLYGFSGNYFYINWGWWGLYNETLFSLDALDVAGYHYNDNQWAIINIYPNYPSCFPITIPSTDVWQTHFLIQNGGGITIGNRTITNGMQGLILSSEYVKLEGGFKVNAGAKVYIGIEDMYCEDEREGSLEPIESAPEIYHMPNRHSAINESLSARKILRDGQVLILRNGHTYTLTGTEVR